MDDGVLPSLSFVFTLSYTVKRIFKILEYLYQQVDCYNLGKIYAQLPKTSKDTNTYNIQSGKRDQMDYSRRFNVHLGLPDSAKILNIMPQSQRQT